MDNISNENEPTVVPPADGLDLNIAIRSVVSKVQRRNHRLRLFAGGGTALGIAGLIAAGVSVNMAPTKITRPAITTTLPAILGGSTSKSVPRNSYSSGVNTPGILSPITVLFARTTSNGIGIVWYLNKPRISPLDCGGLYSLPPRTVPQGMGYPAPVGGQTGGANASGATSSVVGKSLAGQASTSSSASANTLTTLPPVTSGSGIESQPPVGTTSTQVNNCARPQITSSDLGQTKITVSAENGMSQAFETATAFGSVSSVASEPLLLNDVMIGTFWGANSSQVLVVAVQAQTSVGSISLLNPSGEVIDSANPASFAGYGTTASSQLLIVAAYLNQGANSGCAIPSGYSISVASDSNSAGSTFQIPAAKVGTDSQACSSLSLNETLTSSTTTAPPNTTTTTQPTTSTAVSSPQSASTGGTSASNTPVS